MLSDLLYRLRALLRRGDMDRELDDELRFHLERETEKLVRAGMSQEDATRQARLAFGGVERVKDESRDARGATRAPARDAGERLRRRAQHARGHRSAGAKLAVGSDDVRRLQRARLGAGGDRFVQRHRL